MTEGEPGIVGSLSDASSSESQNQYPPPPMALSDAASSPDSQNRQSESPNPNPNPNPGEPAGIPDASSDIQSRRQSDSPNPKPMTTERGKRSRPEEPDQIEPKTKKSTSSIEINPKCFPWNPRLLYDKPRTASWAYGDSFTSKPDRLEHLPSPRSPPANLTPPPLLTDIKCEICGGDHGSTYCSYWVKVPDDAKLMDDSCYQIFCECNAPIVDGDCCSAVCSGRPRMIVQKSVRYMTPADLFH